MLQTAEVVAKHYGISREAQDAFALQSQRRTAAAQEAGKFDDEIVPFTTTKAVMDKQTNEGSQLPGSHPEQRRGQSSPNPGSGFGRPLSCD
ncbi:hypothetical protein N8456_01365 [Porticoccaceae bacterium]|nr:hypothetical protein [Porticoccaceae bacterium]